MRIRNYVRPAAYIATASACLMAYTLLTPPMLAPDRLAGVPVYGRLVGDVGAYALRFTLSFLLLGIVPLVVALLCGENLRSLGFTFTLGSVSGRLFCALAIAFAVIGITSAFLPDLSRFYPYSRTLLDLIRGHPIYVVVHCLAYLLLYYLPWEFFFRGYLVFPLLRMVCHHDSPNRQQGAKTPSGDNGVKLTPRSFLIASIPIIPSLLLHAGHPVGELVGVVAGGFVFGILSIKTSSFVPGLVLHSAIGLMLDCVIVLRHLWTTAL